MKYTLFALSLILFACENNNSTGPDTSSNSSSAEVSSVEESSSSVKESSSSEDSSPSSEGDNSSSSDTDSTSSVEDNSSSSVKDSVSSVDDNSSSSISSMDDNSSSSVLDSISSMDDHSSSSLTDTISSMDDNSSSSVTDTTSSMDDSSSSSLEESSSSEDIASSSSEFVHVLDTGSFTDARDNQVYTYTVIGTQTWMAQNLNFETDEKSYCYDDDPANCEIYGRLYEWDEAMQGHPADDTLKIQGVCPAGWHLPSVSAWYDLAFYVDSNSVNGGHGVWDFYEVGLVLRSTSGWKDLREGGSGNGTDLFGFNALPSGRRTLDGFYNNLTSYAFYMSTSGHDNATPSGPSTYAYFQLRNNDSVFDHNWEIGTVDAYSVRCIKD